MSKERKEIDGTAFHVETPDEVCHILNRARQNGWRLRWFYGTREKYWLEEYGVTGTIGRSGGSIKIPLCIANSKSLGGGGILDDCIVRIQDTQSKRVLWEADWFKFPMFQIKEASVDIQEKYNKFVSVFVDGEGNVANFRTRKQAENYVAFMTGKRMAK